eukprot:Gb_29672 [translate_table: standard]
MVPAVLCPIGTIQSLPGRTITSRTKKHSRNSLFPEISRHALVLPHKMFALRTFSITFVPELRKKARLEHSSILQILSATVGNEVALQEPNVESDKVAMGGGASDDPSEAVDSLETDELAEVGESAIAESSPIIGQSKRPGVIRKNETPRIPNEELVPGATFTGKVRAIQSFGAFVDFGASTDGLVHISRLSDSFVKEVTNVVSIGQEVTVRVLEANTETGRIALTMRASDDPNRPRREQASDNSSSSGESSGKVVRTGKIAGKFSPKKREETQKSSKLRKGQTLEGKVKNMIRTGAFISLPDGEEGFLRSSEVNEGFGKISGSMGLQVGQDVTVRVLRIERGRVSLTMKKEEDMTSLNMQLNQGVTEVATNPFELAFRKNSVIAAFLDEQERLQKVTEPPEAGSEVEEHNQEKKIEAIADTVHSGEEVASTEQVIDDKMAEIVTGIAESIEKDEVSETPESKDALTDFSMEQANESSTLSTEQVVDSGSTRKEVGEVQVDEEEEHSETPQTKDVLTNGIADQVDESSKFSTEQVVDNETTSKNMTEVQGNKYKVMDSTSVEAKDASVTDPAEIEESARLEPEKLGTTLEANLEGVSSDSQERADSDSNGAVSQVNPFSEDVNVSENAIPELDTIAEQREVVIGQSFSTSTSEQGNIHSSNEVATIIDQPSSVNDNDLEIKSETNVDVSANAGTISAALVKQLREETGAGMMDCKKALAETGGDLEKAREFLRKKGLASAEKAASRIAAEGRISSYIHDSRIGVLIEVNCETDFVSRGEIFRELVEDLAMQVAASPRVQYVSVGDISEDIVSKEREIELQKEDLLNKPEQIRAKIVDGRIGKILGELSLLEQPYIKNDKLIVKDWIKQTIATLGENIQVRRFVRYNLGEGLEKKNQDFAAEVVAQTAAKKSPSEPAAELGVEAESSTTAEDVKPPEKQSALISAALVKKLREETGAGMMDCKKALTETDGDLEKAQEFLRKKGLASADKKSGRIAAEGRVGSYIHDSRIGVLIEVNCETDFVSRGDIFKQLVEDLAMQVVACPQVQHVSVEDISNEVVNKEREIEMQREDLLAKPEGIREKIVDGRMAKRLGELALLEQPFIKDDTLLVKDVVKQAVATLGENIRVRRFIRYNLGEGLEKKTNDLAAEIAKQTASKEQD